LANTLVTISDNKIGVDNTNDNLADYYEARVLSATDYYAFGMSMKERSWQSEAYRYGFNGQEKDRDIDEEGNHNTAEFWEYSAVIGRRWNIDPEPTVGISDYVVMFNSPILFSDVLGNKPDDDGNKRKNIFLVVDGKTMRSGKELGGWGNRLSYWGLAIRAFLSGAKLIRAGGVAEAATKIEEYLKKHDAKIGNLVIDSHGHGNRSNKEVLHIGSQWLGESGLSFLRNRQDPNKTISGNPHIKLIGKYMDSESKVLLGACWAGLQEQSLLDLSKVFHSATIYANHAPSNSFRFLWEGSFIGNVDTSYGKGTQESGDRVGKTTIVQYFGTAFIESAITYETLPNLSYTHKTVLQLSTVRIETNIVRIDIKGNIIITNHTMSRYRQRRVARHAKHHNEYIYK
jgi:hypothetical protein